MQGTFEYTLALAKAKLLDQLDDRVNHIHQNNPAMAEQLTKMFDAYAYNTTDEVAEQLAEMFHGQKDDFKELFESHIINILLFIFSIFVLLYSTTYSSFLIYYEKFGADPMKRSLTNQLFSQTGWCDILGVWVRTPISTYRMFIGPISPHLSELFIIIWNVYGHWYVIAICTRM